MRGLLTGYKQRWLSHKLWIMHKQDAEVHCDEITDCRWATKPYKHATCWQMLLNQRKKCRQKKKSAVNWEPPKLGGEGKLTTDSENCCLQQFSEEEKIGRYYGPSQKVRRTPSASFGCKREGLLLWKPSTSRNVRKGPVRKKWLTKQFMKCSDEGLHPVS